MATVEGANGGEPGRWIVSNETIGTTNADGGGRRAYFIAFSVVTTDQPRNGAKRATNQREKLRSFFGLRS